MSWFGRAIPDSQSDTRPTHPETTNPAAEAAPSSVHSSEPPESSPSHISGRSEPCQSAESPPIKRGRGRPRKTDEQKARQDSTRPSNTGVKRRPGRPSRGGNEVMTSVLPNNASEALPRKRGRPPKTAVAEEPPRKRGRPSNGAEEPPLRRGRSSNVAEEPPRKRGRPPKESKPETVMMEQTTASPATGIGRGRPRSSVKVQENGGSINSATPQPAKKRGRPPKVKSRGRPRLSDEVREAREAAKQLTEKRSRGRPRKSDSVPSDTDSDIFDISMIEGQYRLESDEVAPYFSENDRSMQLALDEDEQYPGSFSGSFSLGDVEGVMYLASTEESLDRIWEMNNGNDEDNADSLAVPSSMRRSRKKEADRSAKLERWLQEAGDTKTRLLMKWHGYQPSHDDATASSVNGSDGFIDFSGNGTTLEGFAQILSSHFMDAGLHFSGRKMRDNVDSHPDLL